MDEVTATLDDVAANSPSSAEAVTDVLLTDELLTDELLTDELLDDELLVEEISIDGMCGVY